MAFDGSDGNPNNEQMNALAAKARELQAQLQKELGDAAAKEYNSIVDAGQIKVKMTGDFTVHQIYISPDYLSTHTTQQISDAITLAFNNCKRDIDSERQAIIANFQEQSNETVYKILGQKNDGGKVS